MNSTNYTLGLSFMILKFQIAYGISKEKKKLKFRLLFLKVIILLQHTAKTLIFFLLNSRHILKKNNKLTYRNIL